MQGGGSGKSCGKDVGVERAGGSGARNAHESELKPVESSSVGSSGFPGDEKKHEPELGSCSTDEEKSRADGDGDLESSEESEEDDSPYSPEYPHFSPDRVDNFQLRPFMPVEQRASDLLISVMLSADDNRQRICGLAFAAMEELTRRILEKEPLGKAYGKRKMSDEGRHEYHGPHHMDPLTKAYGKRKIVNDEGTEEFKSLKATIEEITKLVEVGESHQIPSFDFLMEPTRNRVEGESSMPSPRNFHPAPDSGFEVEFSEESAIIFLSPLEIVQILMDARQWSYMFSNIVSRALTLGLILRGEAGTLNGALQVMTAEFHLPSPFVPIRENYFARYCKQLPYNAWAVVDASLENLFSSPRAWYRRKPSGCLIQKLPNGHSKVTWIEHAEVNHIAVPYMFERLITSGFAFSAKRWISALVRQSERRTNMGTYTIPNHDEETIPEAGRINLMKLGDRMVRKFTVDITASVENEWLSMPVPYDDNIKINIRSNINEPGRPPGVSLVVATTVRIAAQPNLVFDFLRDVESQTKWNVLLFRHPIKEIMRFHSGQHPGNRLTILEVQKAQQNQVPILFLQESYTDSTGSYVVYAPIDMSTMAMVLSGGNSDYVPIQPSGFTILPDRPTTAGENSDGTILTVAFEVVDDESTADHIPSQSVAAIHMLIHETIYLIESVLVPDDSD